MRCGGYLGGSSIEGPGYAYYRPDQRDGEAPRVVDADLQSIMAEHDRLRARGIDPVQQIKAAKKRKNAMQRAKKQKKREEKLRTQS